MLKPIDLHVFNGDFALDVWKKCGFIGNTLVWKEIYLEGPLPETDDLHRFRTARAEYLSHFAELSDIDISRLYKHLQRMDDAILSLPENASLMLWFDSCIFDQTILMRILYLLNSRKNGLPEIFLYCCKGNCLSSDDFERGAKEKTHLTRLDLETAAKAWLAFQSHDAERMKQLLREEEFQHLPQMKTALERCMEEIPDENGLSRTQRQMLQLISRGASSFVEIFKGLDSFEELPFLGDTGCQRILDDLLARGWIEKNPDNRYQLAGKSSL